MITNSKLNRMSLKGVEISFGFFFDVKADEFDD